jgi:circadian clock protein KaiC
MTESSDQARLSTGVEGFDAILGGGLVCGCAYIIQGPPGAGKTVLANQICFHLADNGKKSVYVSLLAESHDRMLSHMSGMAFFHAAHIPDAITYISGYPTLTTEKFSGLIQLVHNEARRHGASLVVFDGLFVAHDAAEDDKEFRAFVHELQGTAASSGCTLLILTNQNRASGSPEHTMVDGWIEILDELHGARAIRSIVVKKQRGAKYQRGRHQFEITDKGIEIFSRLESALMHIPSESQDMNRLSTGIDGLDRMIGGGYPAGSPSILAGPSGTGKTTFGLQFLSRSTPEEPGLLFGFYETTARILSKARSIGIDIDGLIASGALETIWQSPAENLPDKLGHRLLQAIERRSVRRVFFDGIGALRHSFIFPERVPLFLNAINNTLRVRDVTIVYSLELPTLFLPDQIVTDELSSIAENIFLTYYVRPTEGSSRRERIMERELLVLKVRDSSFDAYPEVFHITENGVRFGGDETVDLRPGGVVGHSTGG